MARCWNLLQQNKSADFLSFLFSSQFKKKHEREMSRSKKQTELPGKNPAVIVVFLMAVFTAHFKIKELWATALFFLFVLTATFQDSKIKQNIASNTQVNMQWRCGRRWQVASRMMSLWNGYIGLISRHLFSAFVIKTWEKQLRKHLSTGGRRKTIKNNVMHHTFTS